MRQKFKQGTYVHICKDLGMAMSHFESDVDAIVVATYSQLYGGTNISDYELLLLDNETHLPTHTSAWYSEWQLSEIEPLFNIDGEEVLEKYRFGEIEDLKKCLK